MSVNVTRRVIEMGDRGARGRDGLTGDYFRLTQTNASGSEVQAEVDQDGTTHGIGSLYGLAIGYASAADSMSLEIEGVNDGDERLIKYARTDINVSPADLEIGDLLMVRGRPDGSGGIAHWEMMAPGLLTATEAETLARTRDDVAVTPDGLGEAIESIIAPLDWALRHGVPNPSKKCVTFKQAEHRWLERLPLKYDAGVNPSNSDYAEYEMVNAGPFQSPAIARCWALNSLRHMVDGRLILLSHFSFDSLAGSQWNNGMGPSTAEFAMELGEQGATVDATNFAFKGPWHGGMGYVSSQKFINGSSAVDYADPANAPVGLILWCDSVSYQQIFTLLIGSAIACRTDLTHDFISDNPSGQCRIEHTHDFTHGSVTAIHPCIRTGYAHMLATTGSDYVKKLGAAAVDMVADPDGNIAHGQTTQIAHWRSTISTALVELILAYGVPMRIGTSVGTLADDNWTYCHPSQYVLTLVWASYGAKTYVSFCSQAGGSVTVTSFQGKVVRCQAFYRIKSGTPS